mmetsp:Transcript_13601/g.9783  ORF Transcript_13601/g.9783 Transcript_13601/m.9783 type:complete len:122 (+) Transcript_13601:113-478(+)
MGFKPGEQITEDMLKKQYLERAKVVHPDVSGSNEEFKVLQEAYQMLKAELKGFNLSEDDVREMYQRQRQRGAEEREQEARKAYEEWKKQRFSSFDQEAHDEFLKDRYQKNFYKFEETSGQY